MRWQQKPCEECRSSWRLASDERRKREQNGKAVHPVPSEPNTVTPLLVNSKTASTLLGICSRRLWVLTNMNAIPSRKIGASVRYSPVELQAWINCGCPTEGGAGDSVRKAVAS